MVPGNWAGDLGRAQATTVAPSRPNSMAIARPRPLLLPVTIATIPFIWSITLLVPGRNLVVCGLSGLCQGLAIAALFQALSRAPVTVVSPINASSPLITLLLVHLFLRRLETITPLLVAETLLSVTGVVVVIGALVY